ncbi:hypothetical protein H7849_09985 [Alloacidobacterium dinghuense]|uniref:Squalene cyclase C-terminal domain-containing protein n=1 Tax=Alloacidobacterium dinghuense TaxID=2763107 RepID=A0A7G8BNS3_9BACT|nr:hypothetical protein [Alloacidobacterium dinghuense]QNI34193.1 hypothetical protein H7849_09985 [Alloacidobacterium dinghuense]
MDCRSLVICIQATTLSLSIVLPGLAETHSAKTTANAKADSTINGASWDKVAAAKYLDSREVWWQAWPPAQKDHETLCISCHTNVPYALARPVLRGTLGEQKLSEPERVMLASIIKRVNLGEQAEPFYNDAKHGTGKTKEARNTESVFNALILSRYDARQGHLQDVTHKAFASMWAAQEQTGPKAGAWIWQNFHFSPWEADESEYFGATMAAIAVAGAPDHYRDEAAIQGNLALLREYLRREVPRQPLINHMLLLWASTQLSGLITDAERATVTAEIIRQQQSDGGWSLTMLGTWKRHDDSPFDHRSDGYATAVAVLALEGSGSEKDGPELRRGIDWLLENQNKAEGFWPAYSLNVRRDPASGVGQFMSDAATAFAVLALDGIRSSNGRHGSTGSVARGY